MAGRPSSDQGAATTNMPQVDRKSMRSMINGFPSMLAQVKVKDVFLSQAQEAHEKGLRGLCLVGMGGSSIAGEMCRGLLSKESPLPIFTSRDYSLPLSVDGKWAVIIVSYSGNTEETLASWGMAKERGCEVFVVTSGGELAKTSDGPRLQLLPEGLQPRAVLPLIFSVVYPLACKLLGVKTEDLRRISTKLESLTAEWGSGIPAPEATAASLANNIPLFIGSAHIAPVAYRAKCQVNENAKSAAFWSEIPEANHNEIESVGTFLQHRIIPVMITSRSYDNRTARRFQVTREIMAKQGLQPLTLGLDNSPRLEEMLAMTHYLDTVSLILAELGGVNPLSVDRIADLKTKMRA